MIFRTEVNINRSKIEICHNDTIISLGSCFSENIGNRLKSLKFNTNVNPFGTLYNPKSISQAIIRIIENKKFSKEEIFEEDGLWHTYWHHTRFSDTDAEKFIENANNSLNKANLDLRNASRIFITFGTAWIYTLKSTGETVANCHKQPSANFIRQRLSVSETTSIYKDVIEKLSAINPNAKIIFSVSPIRHWKDGAHENQISKSTLLLAIEEITSLFPDKTEYFPSFEIVMDDLRDYRFYAEDMLHPNDTAINYIWQKFADCYFSGDTATTIKKIEKLISATKHRAFSPQSNGYIKFKKKMLNEALLLQKENPSIDLSEEIKHFE